MIKFTYFAPYESKNSGVFKKITSQVDNLKKIDLDTNMVIISGINFKIKMPKSKIIIKIIDKLPIIQSILRQIHIYIILNNTLKSLNRKDILYLRAPIPTPLNIFALMKKKSIIISEFQTIEIFELKLKSQLNIYIILDLLFKRDLLKKIDAIVGVTEEITQYQLKRAKNFKKPHITIGNGVDVTSIPIRQINALSNKIHLLFVANVSRWHGIDRLIQGIHIYKNTYEICLHIVGDGKELPILERLVVELNLSKQIIFHGFKTGEELDSLFNSCHIAVGSLGIHRIGLNESSTLKAREYCARGIPYIIACGDPDFPDDFPYIFRLPPDESPIDIESVINFAQKVCSDPDHPQKMRKYAEENLDWAIKMKKLKEFLETLVDEHQSV